MIDLRIIREQPERVRQAAENKGIPVDIDRLLAVDRHRRQLETEYNELRHQQKSAGEQMAAAAPADRAALARQLGELKARIRQLEQQREQVDGELRELLLRVPQIPDPQAPVGPDPSANVELRRVGTPRCRADYGERFRDHLELGSALGLVDMERGVKLAGSRNYVLTGVGAMLHEAVLRLAWDLMLARSWPRPGDAGGTVRFTPLNVPVLVLEKLMEGTGFFPLHRDEVYLCERDGQCLVGTSEVPVTGLHADEILDVDELPRLYLARSTCFRREAGAAGKDTRGLYRIHYFDKLEQVVICRPDPEESRFWHAVILQNAEDVLAALELPYRVVDVCTGDMGQAKVRQFDIETWMPGRDAYGETHSASAYHDFQARRLNIRCRSPGGKPQICFTLNSTVIASPRILIPLLEVHQTADGGVTIPAALRPYLGGRERIDPPAQPASSG